MAPLETEPLVSVVMIFLNEKRFLQESIDSVIGQTYPQWELLLVELRGAICHALMEEATIEGHPGLTWRLPGDKDWRNRKSLTDQELAGLLSDLKHQTKRFRNQLLKQL